MNVLESIREIFENSLIVDFETLGLVNTEPLEVAYCPFHRGVFTDIETVQWPLRLADVGYMEAGSFVMHTKNGLIDECLRNTSPPNLDSLVDIARTLGAASGGSCKIAGFSPHFDYAVLKRLGMGGMFSHRLIDVSLLCRAFGIVRPSPDERIHRARDDVFAVRDCMWKILSTLGDAANFKSGA